MLSSRFEHALVYAAQLHAAQLRKGTEVPYIAHLLGVASIALEFGATEDEAIAALLHDAVEDQGGDATRREIQAKFGPAVAAIVDGCTDADTLPKPPWEARKKAYLAHLATAPDSVLLVSAADKLYNARSIVRDYRALGEALWGRFRGGRDGTLWYYRALVEAYRGKLRADLFEELSRTVEEMGALAGNCRAG